MTNDTHRWTGRTPRVRPDGTRIEAGQALTPTDNEQRCWPDRLEAIDESEVCMVTIEGGDREGEPCGRELPCAYHSEESDAGDGSESEESSEAGS